MNVCDVCQEESSECVPVANRVAGGFLFVCSECCLLHQEEHFEDVFKSPIDFRLFNADRYLFLQVA